MLPKCVKNGVEILVFLVLEATSSIEVEKTCLVNLSLASKRLRFKVVSSATDLKDIEVDVVFVNTLSTNAVGASRELFVEFTQK